MKANVACVPSTIVVLYLSSLLLPLPLIPLWVPIRRRWTSRSIYLMYLVVPHGGGICKRQSSGGANKHAFLF